MAWTDRLRKTIKFISPSGLEFTPLWKGNEISAKKRLGRHAYPNLDNEVVQDLGMESRDYPLTVYFDGPDNDKDAWAFGKALCEPETWKVTHPVYGLLFLQLVSFKFKPEPVDSGNVTVFETAWIEPASNEEIKPEPDPAAEVEAAVEAVKEGTLKDSAAITQDGISKANAAANGLKQGLNAVKCTIQSANARINTLQAQINDFATTAYLDIASIAGGVIELLEAPDLMAKSVSSKIALFSNLGKKIMSNMPHADSANTTGHEIAPNMPGSLSNKTGQKNLALAGQLFLNAITVGLAKSVISNLPESRREALATLNEFQRFSREAEEALDKSAALTAEERIEDQFVPRASSGEAIATLNTAVVRYVMRALFDLKIERRMVLDRPRAPLEIAITEYKATGESADYYFDLFCRTNDLHKLDVLLLPAGREVVIYV